jgi:hypothetical protein
MNRAAIRVFTLFAKDLKDAIRDARVLVALIVPLGIGLFYNFTFNDSSITTINGSVAIAGAEQSRLPELITGVLPDNVNIDFFAQPDRAAVEAAVGNEDTDIGIIVPAQFDELVESGARPELTVIRSPSPSVPGDYVLSALEPVIRAMAGQSVPATIAIDQAVAQESDTITDKIGIRTWSLAVAIIMMLALISALAIPIVLAEEFEKKTIDALVLAMPYREVIIAKATLGLFYILVMVTIFVNLTSLQIEDWTMFVIGTGLTGVALLGFGLLLAGLLKNPNQLNTWSGIFLMPFIAPAIVIGQPVPDLARTLAGAFPSGAGMKLILEAVATEDLFDDMLKSVLVLLVWTIAAYLLLLWQLKRRQA